MVLDGLPLEPGTAARLQAAIAAELGRRLAASGLSPEIEAGGALASLSGGAVRWTPGLSPEALGARLAQAIHASLSGREAAETFTPQPPCPSS